MSLHGNFGTTVPPDVIWKSRAPQSQGGRALNRAAGRIIVAKRTGTSTNIAYAPSTRECQSPDAYKSSMMESTMVVLCKRAAREWEYSTVEHVQAAGSRMLPVSCTSALRPQNQMGPSPSGGAGQAAPALARAPGCLWKQVSAGSLGAPVREGAAGAARRR